jgi:predicted protein tyrosine phosphatase
VARRRSLFAILARGVGWAGVALLIVFAGLVAVYAAISALTVCGLDELDRHSERGVTHVLSILDPEWPEPKALQDFEPHARVTFRFHDAIEPEPGVVLPQKFDIDAILAFGREAGDMHHLLIHCHAGISRSTAAMLMILAQAHPNEIEDAIVERLLEIRPQAWPNSRMIRFADELLGRHGRLSAAVARVYARRLEIEPDLAQTMRRLNRAREVELGLAGRREPESPC